MKSIVTNESRVCALCGKPAEAVHHLIGGQGKRKVSNREGLTIPLCNDCHNMGPVLGRIHGNPAAEKLSKMLGQACFERRYIAERRELPFEDIEAEAREAFREAFGKSYL